MQIDVYVLKSGTKGLNGKITRISYDFWFSSGLSGFNFHYYIPSWSYGYKKRTGWKSIIRYAIWKGIAKDEIGKIPEFVKLQGIVDKIERTEFEEIIKGRTN